MQDGSPVLSIVNTCLLAGVLLSTVMVTCSNDRLEGRILELNESMEQVKATTEAAQVDLTPVLQELANVRAELATRPVAAAGAAPAGTSTPAPTASVREPGAESPVVAVGWKGRRAKITYVEGAVPNAPLRRADKPRPQGDHNVGWSSSPPASLNYFTTSDGLGSRISKHVLGRMMDLDDPNLPAVQPSLATSWEVSEDKLTYTFHLRRGVQFADGRPFTSADVLFSFGVVRDPTVNSDHLKPEFEDVRRMTAPDPYTVVVEYRRPYWKGLYAVGYSLRVLNKAWYEEQIPKVAAELGIEKWSAEPGKPGFGAVFNKMRYLCPGTGPYYFAKPEDFDEEGVELVANPFSWKMQVHPELWNFDKLRWVFIADPVAKFEAFRKERFDVTVVDADRYEDSLKNDPTITSIATYHEYDHMALDCSYIAWNCRRPPFDDPRVRTAMTHLTNRKWILEELERNKGTIAVCKSKQIYPTYSHDLEAHPFDIERARALLAEAGWTDTNGDGVLDRDGKRFEFDFMIPSSRDWFVRVGGALQDACKQVGIRMTVAPAEWATFLEDLQNRRFDALCLYNSWSDPWIDPGTSYHSSQDVPYGNNHSGWRSPEADAIFDAMVSEFDEERRIELFHRFNELYYEAQPETLLIHGLVSVLRHKRFEDAEVMPTGMVIDRYWVKPENRLHK